MCGSVVVAWISKRVYKRVIASSILRSWIEDVFVGSVSGLLGATAPVASATSSWLKTPNPPSACRLANGFVALCCQWLSEVGCDSADVNVLLRDAVSLEPRDALKCGSCSVTVFDTLFNAACATLGALHGRAEKR